MAKSSSMCISCSTTTGSFNGNYKGGKTRHKKGYVMQSAPSHPRVLNTINKYVFEHILVMEQFLGRYLLPGENIHHKNGVKDDNRIENLELWVIHQPAGQRAEDLLNWAYQIIDRYGSDPTNINS